MCVFHRLILKPPYCDTLRYIPYICACYSKYKKYLCDDFASDDPLSYIMDASPFLWVITDINSNFMGFVSLDNFTGSENRNFSAEVLTCFDKKAWGSFTRYSAKFFFKKCFDEFGFYKINALIYPDNFRISKLLKSSGFVYESTLKNQTLRNGKPQDIDIYAIYRNYYYKDEVNYG